MSDASKDTRPMQRLGGGNWTAVILLGFSGQLAWAVENQFFNTFLYEKITPDPRPISWMVSITAVVALLTTILMGTLSDGARQGRWGRRRPFMLIGYLFWGIFTAVYPAAALFRSVTVGVGMAILFDSVMSFWGSTANDAAFNAWITDITTPSNRGAVMGISEVLKWTALLLTYGGAGFLVAGIGYTGFFVAVGAIAVLLGSARRADRPGARGDRASPRRLLEEDRGHLPMEEPEGEPHPARDPRGRCGVERLVQRVLPLPDDLPPALRPPARGAVLAADRGGDPRRRHRGGLPARPARRPVGRRPMALTAIALEAAGLLLFSLSKSFPALLASGILWVMPMAAWTIATNAWEKDLFPEDKRGQWQGWEILFRVTIAMTLGPLLGGWLASRYGIPTVLDGKPGFIPTPLLFQVAAAGTVLALIPLLAAKEEKRTAASAL